MATLPRTTKPSFADRQPDFDAGINASSAWTEHLQESSSDAEPNNDAGLKSGRTLYDFEGKPEFRELTVTAGEEIWIVREDLAGGWSLVRDTKGEIGLLPRTYYTLTFDFTTSPLNNQESPSVRREASSGSITPTGSPNSLTETQLPLVPQTTGDWRIAFPSFTRSLLGSKSFNRFSTFVTSGAEDWVLNGVEEPEMRSLSHSRASSVASEFEANPNFDTSTHFIQVGPSWQSKISPFRALVHSPSKRTSSITGAYTLYSVTTLFPPSTDSESDASTAPVRITVYRRFSQFVLLHTALARRLSGIALPPLPEKQYTGRFNDDFVEARRGDLERYLNKVIRHPVARYTEVITFFLSCESDIEWKRNAPHLLLLPTGFSFFGRIFHPAFNFDLEEASEVAERFDTHTRAIGKGVQALRSVFSRVRDARVEMSKAERSLSYSLLSLITSKPLASALTTGVNEEEDAFNGQGKGLLNQDGAWCWRETCDECLRLTKAIQRTSETMQSVADVFEDHARRTQLATHDRLKDVAHPNPLYRGVVETHRSTLSHYQEATRGTADDDMAARSETVLNVTLAEMDHYHAQKNEDFRSLMTEHLDGEIAFYEQVLCRLKSARQMYEEPVYSRLSTSPRQTSIYERELEHPRTSVAPLPQPCPHVYDSAPMRPVSMAVQGGVGLLLGSGASRGSVFGRFWS